MVNDPSEEIFFERGSVIGVGEAANCFLDDTSLERGSVIGVGEATGWFLDDASLGKELVVERRTLAFSPDIRAL